MISNDITRIELDQFDGYWLATIFCIPVADKPRVHELKIRSTSLGPELNPNAVMHEVGSILGLEERRSLDFVLWQQERGDPDFYPCVMRQQGQSFWRAEEYR